MCRSCRVAPGVSASVRNEVVAVPETCGDDEHVVLMKLRRCGLVAGERILEPSRSVRHGTVFGTIPSAGTEVARGQSVAYVVADVPQEATAESGTEVRTEVSPAVSTR